MQPEISARPQQASEPSPRGKHLPYPHPVGQCGYPVGVFSHHLTEDIEEDDGHSNCNEYQPPKDLGLNHHISPDTLDSYIDAGGTPLLMTKIHI